MDGLFTLLSLSLVMAIVSFVVGSLPLSFSLSSSQLRLISALGMGVLVGTSLIVIIPEGVETLYSSTAVSHTHTKRDVAGHSILDARWQPPSVATLWRRDESDVNPDKGSSDTGEGGKLYLPDDEPMRQEEEEEQAGQPQESHESSPHAWIGVALISGFILMYLVDTLPAFAASSAKQQRGPYHISLDNLGSGLGRAASPARGGGLLDAGGSSRQGQSFATTTGLVIHAAADGIALGASTSNSSLSFIIFFAIMVHKAPAAFGLTSVLLKQGLSNRAARGHLLVFSLAAPVGALFTWIIAHTVMAGHAGDESATRWRTGMLLLFSAGTFLYVAMHTMQENGTEPSRRDVHANGYAEGRDGSQRPQKSMRDLIASVVGMIIPLFLQIGHAH
ncbi:hypothetical protein FQN55_005080 [Onygenales sp. PD_40]|nr:hypothetical protein FQN55_005080 [Onygenales sp. PD_40]